MWSYRAIQIASRLLGRTSSAPALPYNYARIAGTIAAGFGLLAYNKFANTYNREFTACHADDVKEGIPKTVQIGDDPLNTIVLVRVKN